MIEGESRVFQPRFQPQDEQTLLSGPMRLPKFSERYQQRKLPETPPASALREMLQRLTPGTPEYSKRAAQFSKNLVQAFRENKISRAKFNEMWAAFRTVQRQQSVLMGLKNQKILFSPPKVTVRLAKLLNLPRTLTIARMQATSTEGLNSLFTAITRPILPQKPSVAFAQALGMAEALADPAEQIGNKIKNLADYPIVQLRLGDTPEAAANRLIQDLTNSHSLSPPMSSFRGSPVDEMNRETLKTLLALITHNREALVDVIAAKQAKDNYQIHFCKPILQAITSMSMQEEVEKVGQFLMSEVCTTGGGLRELSIDRFNLLKNDPRVKNNPQLLKAVIKAGRQVQMRAIRKMQASLLQDTLKKLDKAGWKELIVQLEENTSKHHEMKSLIKFVSTQSQAFTEALC